MVTVYRIGDKVKGRYYVKFAEVPILVESIVEGLMDQSGRVVRISRFRTFRVVIVCQEADLVRVDFEPSDKIFFKEVAAKGGMHYFARETSTYELATFGINNLVFVKNGETYMLSSNAAIEFILDIPIKAVYDLSFDGVPVIDYDTEEVKEDGEGEKNVCLQDQ